MLPFPLRQTAVCAVLAAGLLISRSTFASDADWPADWDDFVESGMSAWRVPGLAIAVVKDGEVAHLKGYGVREAGGDEPVDAETVFAIGSTTKAFTSAALGALVDAGKTRWDTPVKEIMPSLQLSDPWIQSEIRVSDLLANHSGLGADSEALWYGTDLDRAEILAALAHIPFVDGFRYQFQYRNVMFLLAGELIPHLSGKSWDQAVAETFFEPLEMARTFPTDAALPELENVAKPHVIGYDGQPVAVPYRAMDNIAPAGSIISCARDLVPWMLLHLQMGEFDGKKILAPETVAFLHRSHTPLSTTGPAGQRLDSPSELPAYALGWVTESYRGVRLVWHNGGIDGMSTWIGLAPSLGLGVAVVSNLDECDLRKAIFYRLVDVYAGNAHSDRLPGLIETHRSAIAARDAAEEKWNRLVASPPDPVLPLAAYAKTYQHPAFGTVEVAIEGDRLVYRRTPQQMLDLVPEAENAFLARFRNSAEDLRSGKIPIRFETADGRVVALVEQRGLTFQAARE